MNSLASVDAKRHLLIRVSYIWNSNVYKIKRKMKSVKSKKI